MSEPENIRRFKVAAGAALASAYRTFPQRADVDYEAVSSVVLDTLPPREDLTEEQEAERWVEAIFEAHPSCEFLVQEGFIHGTAHRDNKKVHSASLTFRGLMILSDRTDEEGDTLGTKLVAAVETRNGPAIEECVGRILFLGLRS